MARRTRQEKYPDTQFFHYYNANSHNHKTTDCVVRALCTVTDMSWEDCLTELFNIAIKKGYTPTEDKVAEIFLTNHGFEKRREPRKDDNTKMSIKEWICKRQTSYEKRVYAGAGSHHVVAIMNGVVHDIWDSSKETMHSYWVKV